MAVGDRLKALREHHGLTVDDLAELSEIHPTTIYKLESGSTERVHATTADALSGCPVRGGSGHLRQVGRHRARQGSPHGRELHLSRGPPTASGVPRLPPRAPALRAVPGMRS